MGRPTGRCWHLTAGPWAAVNHSELSSFICSDREICYCHAQARQAEFRGTRLPRWGTQRERVKQPSLSVGTLGPVTSPAAVTHCSFPVSINHEAVVLLSSRSLLVQTAVSLTSHTHTDDRYPPPCSLLFEHISSIMLPVQLTTDLLSFFISALCWTIGTDLMPY